MHKFRHLLGWCGTILKDKKVMHRRPSSQTHKVSLFKLVGATHGISQPNNHNFKSLRAFSSAVSI